MKTIKLEEIYHAVVHVQSQISNKKLDTLIIEAMKEACEKAIDLCAENFKLTTIKKGMNYFKQEEEILNTKNQIQ
jgi:hypothetical protein